jgi:phosphate transport system permease protein
MKKKIRNLEEKIFEILMVGSVLIVIGSLLFIIGTILINGIPAMNWDMISKTPKGGFYLGREGGILNAIIGSFYIGIGSTLLAMIFSLPIVIYLHFYTSKDSAFSRYVRFALNILWGIPSIVYGAFGFLLMIFLGLKVSLLAGIITVSLVILPVMTKAIDEAVKTVPFELKETLFSLGSTKFEASMVIIFKQALPGVLTALLISFGRAIGDAAAVLFTTGYTDNIPTSLTQPAATLPLAIFFQLSSPIPEVRERAYAAALVMTVLILLITQLTRYLSKKYSTKSGVI